MPFTFGNYMQENDYIYSISLGMLALMEYKALMELLRGLYMSEAHNVFWYPFSLAPSWRKWGTTRLD